KPLRRQPRDDIRGAARDGTDDKAHWASGMDCAQVRREMNDSPTALAAKSENLRRGSFMMMLHQVEHLPRHTINHIPTSLECPLLGVKRTLLLVLDVLRRSSKRCLLAMNWRSRRD